MKKKLKKLFSGSIQEQAGQALLIVLVFFLLGSLTLAPVLMQMATSLKTQTKYENKTNELFTADAGIENGLWRIKNDFLGPTYSAYDFTTVWPFLTDPVNSLTAAVQVQNVWLPTNASLTSLGITPDQAKTMVDSEKLVVTGSSGAVPGQPYHIKVEFHPATGDNLTIKSIGIWLPQGFTYTTGSSELEQAAPSAPCRSVPSVSAVPGGQAVVWNYNPNSPPLFITFPHFVSENGTMTSTFDFAYSPPADNPAKLPVAVAWVTCEMHDQYGGTVLNPNSIENVPIAWDTDSRFYRIISDAGKTQIDTYSSKSQLRKLGDAIAGNYVAIGNSLMTGGSNPDYIKTTLLPSSTANVTAVAPDYPATADVITSYLYWSGFQYDISQWSDNGTDFYNWDRSAQNRVPTSDNATIGTWNTAPCWDEVDETTYNDGDYMTGNTSLSNNYKLFGFLPFSVPAGATVTDISVYFRARDFSSGTNNIQACVKAGSTNATAGSVNPGSSWATYIGTFTTNPDTGAAWTVADINGTGTHPLRMFGVYSSDLNPAVQVSMVYAEVNYSLWTINSGQFQATGSSNATTAIRTLTLKNSLDLSSYPQGQVSIGWKQTKSNNLESPDTFYYAVSGDGGATWSPDMISFDYNDTVESPYYYVIPAQYKTSAFKIRFYFNYNATDEYVRLDEINIYYMPPDTTATFKINGQQVYFDADGNPQAGSQPVNASFSAVLVAPNVGTDTPGYFYACFLDVSKLVEKYPVVPGEQHHTGNTNYTVGGVSGDLNQYVSYAGWSLIIIYGSPESVGHYIYLRDIHDVYASCPQNGDLDFDHDGQPGGDITGFVFPEPIKNKDGTVKDPLSASLTCFVCEGDTYTGDYLKITGQQSLVTKNLSNSASPENNVWNSASPGMSYQGIDVDTFQVLWVDGVFTPGDTRVHLGMPTQQDVWNLVYIIVSVRSATVTSGTEHYVITSN
jgi:hypothetical protein